MYSLFSSSDSLWVGQMRFCIILDIILKEQYLKTKEMIFKLLSAGGFINMKQIQLCSVNKPHLELNTDSV